MSYPIRCTSAVLFLFLVTPSETGLDLGLCCRACTWTNLSWRNKIQRNYEGLKITVCMQQLGQITDNKIHKDQKTPTATSEELGAKTGCRKQKQHIVHSSCTQHYLRDGQPTTQVTPPARALDLPLIILQSSSCVRLFSTQWTAARQASLSIINSQSLPKFMSIV